VKKVTIGLGLVAAAVVGSLLTMRFANHPDVPVQVHAQNQQFLSLTFAPVVSKATPAVVNVSSTRVTRRNTRSPGRRQNPFGGGGPEDFFDFFGFGAPNGPNAPNPPNDRRSSGVGSGVIVTADGYILTNNHVVESAEEVKVSLADRREFTAKVVGSDPQSDVAVLKIDARSLPVLPISDSTKVQIGDLALAIGNPFGVGQTVTMGIIGATGRAGLNPGNFEDFIQTDAAINPGNSGGALINTNGQLIGINTAIISGSGGNQGIGFAIPANMAREVMDQLIKTGKVTRGYIGVQIQNLTPELAKEFRRTNINGVLITNVEADTPASRAGLQSGDIVLQVEGSPVSDVNAFRLRISRTAPGTPVRLRIQRDNQERDLSITLGTLRAQGRGPEEGGSPSERGTATAMDGVSVEALTSDIARELRIPDGVRGVVVTSVDPNSAAAEAGLQRGDVIQQVNKRGVATAAEFEQALRQGSRQSVLLLVNRGGGSLFIVVEPRANP